MEKIDEIRQINNEIMIKRDKASSGYNEVNYPVWPEIASLKKKRKYYLWGLTISLCAMLVVVIWILLFEIVNEYWIGGSIGFVSLFIVLFFILSFIVSKKLKKLNTEWEKELKPIKEESDKLNMLCKKAVEMMQEVLKGTKYYDETLNSYDDVYGLYNEYLDNLEGEDK